MTPEQRHRAGLSVAARILDMGTTVPTIAAEANVAPTTIRALIRGARWPTIASRQRICAALRWPAGEIERRAFLGDVRLAEFSILELARELCHRLEDCQR